MQDITIAQRRVSSTGREHIYRERTALEDLNHAEPWIDWTWEYVDRDGISHYSHPAGDNSASLYVQPGRAYNITVNERSYRFHSLFTYLLRFPGYTAFEFADCNYNAIDDAEDIAGGMSVDLDGNGVPDECEEEP